tara:strand:- start:59 stop:265 length:207 start_codon:yes stop_codon:yes gene_type:complete
MKKMNNYTEAISPELYDKTPKAVFAAIAVSFALLMEDGDFTKVDSGILKEWKTLNKNGIVPQKPINLR